MANPSARYLIFDIESVSDGDLIAKVRFPGEGLKPEEAIEKYTGELMEKFGYPLHLSSAGLDCHHQDRCPIPDHRHRYAGRSKISAAHSDQTFLGGLESVSDANVG